MKAIVLAIGLLVGLVGQGLADVELSGPLPAGWWKTLLHLGADFNNDFINSSQESDRDTDFLAGYGGQANQQPYPDLVYNLAAASTGDKNLTWTPLAITAADGRWMTNPDKNSYVKYWHIYINVPGASNREVRFHYRHDDDIRVWNNGALAFFRNGWDGGSAQTYDGTLYAGANAITIKLREGSGGDHMSMRVTDRSNNDYNDLSFTLSLGDFSVYSGLATAVGETTATLNGELMVVGAPPDAVLAVWATDDWDEDLDDWKNHGQTEPLVQPEPGAISHPVSSLDPDTVYRYRFVATNATDTIWSDPVTFKTLGGDPVVNNAGGATPIGGVRATLHGALTGGAKACFSILLGTEPGVWTQQFDFGEQLEGSFSTNVVGLELDTTYYYRAYASNAYNTAWAPGISSFTTAATSAETLIWNGASGDNWNDGGKWLPEYGIYPQALDTAVFSNLVAGGTVNLNGNQAVHALYFGAPTMVDVPSFTISGNTLTLGAGGIHFYSKGGNSTINSAITLSAPSTIASYSGWPNEKHFTLGGALDNAGHTLTLHNPGSRINVNQTISGSGPLRVSGSGAIYLNADNPMTGPVTIAGRAIMDNSTARCSSTPSLAVADGGNFQVGGTGASVADDGVTTFGRIPNNVPFVMYGSAPLVHLLGQNNVATTERVGELTLGHGLTRLLLESGTDSTVTLIPQSVTRASPGHPVCFVYTGTRYNLGSGGNVIFADGGASLTQIGGDGSRITNKKIVPYMFTRTQAPHSSHSRVSGLTDMVYYDPLNGLTQMNPTTDYINAVTLDTFPSVNADGFDNVRLPFSVVKPTTEESRTITLAADIAINALLLYNDATTSNSGTLTIAGTGRTLTVMSGLLMGGIRSGATRFGASFTVSQIDFGAAEGIIINPGPHYGGWTISSALLGSKGLTVYVDTTQTDEGRVVLGGNNSGLSGTYTLIGGPVRATHANAFGNGSQNLVLSNGLLQPWISGDLRVGSIAGIGSVYRIWNASGKRLDIGDNGTNAEDETVRLLTGGSLKPGFADRAGSIEIRDMSHIKLLGGTLEIDLLIGGDSDQLFVSDPGDRNPAVQINGTSLVIALHAEPVAGTLFRIVRVQGPNAITGQFVEGELVEAEFEGVNWPFVVHYNADTDGGQLVPGNSIVIEAQEPTPRGSLFLLR